MGVHHLPVLRADVLGAGVQESLEPSHALLRLSRSLCASGHVQRGDGVTDVRDGRGL